MHRLFKSYNNYVESHIEVLRLIRKCDRNADRILDQAEVHKLLQVPCRPTLCSPDGAPLSWHASASGISAKGTDPGAQAACVEDVSHEDARAVLARLQAMARVSTHGGYEPTMTTDPLIVSKAPPPPPRPPRFERELWRALF